MPIEWDRPLLRRHGSLNRLDGLDVYYDFNWHNMFKHDRAIFPRGQSLAQLVRRDCPVGKTPCLLLTERDDITPGIQTTDNDFIVIVPINDYLRNAGADAASTYYARLSTTPLTQLPSLSEVIFSSTELGHFLDEHLTLETLTSWLSRSSSRLQMLKNLISSDDNSSSIDTATALRNLDVEDLEVFKEFAQYMKRLGGGSQLRELLDQITLFEQGRTAAATMLAHRLPERIADIRNRLNRYDQLIGLPNSSETDVQHFLEANPWVVGLTYVKARARVEIPRGELDFVLDRYDGFFDIVELKGPQEPIIVERQSSEAMRPPSASAYSLSPALAGAIAQAHHYRALLDQARELHDQYGLTDTRQPRILIVLGCSTSLSDQSREVLRQLNLSLHRVEVIPYDLLGTRTLGLLNNLEALILCQVAS
jgi:hypothetical protein